MALAVTHLDDRIALVAVDEAQGGDIHPTVAATLEAGRDLVVLDFDGVDYFNSVNIAGVITARNLVAERGGRLVLANLGGNLRTIFGILKLERLFRLDLDRAAAVASLSSGG